MSRRLYAVGLLLRALLTLLPLSTLHPDEWLQSVEVMSPELLPHIQHVRTWDWQFSCTDDTHPPHLRTAMRATRNHAEWTKTMEATTPAALGWTIPEATFNCPPGMHVQPPIRNTLFPWLAAGLPYQLYRAIWQSEMGHRLLVAIGPPAWQWVLFLLPRLSMLLASILCDALLFSAARSFHAGASTGASSSFAWSTLAAYSLTFPALVWMGRTFSNATETMMLAMALWIASQAFSKSKPATAAANRSNPKPQSITALCLLFGVIVAAGAFVRLSFLFWAWPIGVYLIVAQSRLTKESLFRSALRVSTLVAIPAALVAALLCTLDSLSFETLWLCSHEADSNSCVSGIRGALSSLSQALLSGSRLHLRGFFLLTPWTNYRYNSNPANVAFHGLHPRYLHLTVNLAMMLGPVAYVALVQRTWRVIRAICSSKPVATAATREDLATTAVQPSAASSTELRHRKPASAVNPAVSSVPSVVTASLPAASSLPFEVNILLLCVLWSGLLFLSLIPHQEPRFLLPLIMPAALLLRTAEPSNAAADVPARSSRCRSPVRLVRWLHVVVCVLLLGVLHQGEHLRWLLRASQHIRASSLVMVSYKLYPTPTAFLHAQDLPLLSLFDVSNEEELTDVLKSIQDDRHSEPAVLLLYPGSVALKMDEIRRVLSLGNSIPLVSRSFGSLHLSLDDAPTMGEEDGLPPSWLDRLTLQQLRRPARFDTYE